MLKDGLENIICLMRGYTIYLKEKDCLYKGRSMHLVKRICSL